MSDEQKKTPVNPFSDFALVFNAAAGIYGYVAYKWVAENPAGSRFFLGLSLAAVGLSATCVTAGKVWETYKKPTAEKTHEPPTP